MDFFTFWHLAGRKISRDKWSCRHGAGTLVGRDRQQTNASTREEDRSRDK